MTYFDPAGQVTVQYPASWRTDQVRQGETSYRYFATAATGPSGRPAASVTLVASSMDGTVDAYAQSFLAGGTVEDTQPETRQDARGQRWVFVSADGKVRHRLLLLAKDGRVYGLHAEGDAGAFRPFEDTVAAMERSLTLERAADYREVGDAAQRFSIRIPPSWSDTRTFSGRGSYLRQFTSPAMAVDTRGQAAHASLTVAVEPLAGGAGIDQFREAALARLGGNYAVLSHTRWKDGWADVLRSETALEISRVKRYHRAADGRGYMVSCDAVDAIHVRVAPWCDFIAATLKVGAEAAAR